MMEPYSVLGLKQGATEEEVRQAYRQMARRWHPDRFPAGPERMWAEQKMAEINEAHTAIVSGEAGRSGCARSAAASEREQFRDVRRLMDIGQYVAARHALMRVENRSPEWNYLFGTVLLRLGEYDKSVLYFGIAMRQRPENTQYRAALSGAKAMRDSQKVAALRRRFFGGGKAVAR